LLDLDLEPYAGRIDARIASQAPDERHQLIARRAVPVSGGDVARLGGSGRKGCPREGRRAGIALRPRSERDARSDAAREHAHEHGSRLLPYERAHRRSERSDHRESRGIRRDEQHEPTGNSRDEGRRGPDEHVWHAAR
jgi:hypothetical protein